MTMLREAGSQDCAIWLLGDSNPKNWADALETPLDSRHPTRHNIWTPILDVIQDKVYRQARQRVDTSSLYIRNAIEDPVNKPKGTESAWSSKVLGELQEFRSLVTQFHPIFVFCFGAFSYEYGRRSIGDEPEYAHNHWNTRRLGKEFRHRIEHFDPNGTNIFPLLHATIARGKFIESHKYFCDQEGANYFEFAGSRIADLFLIHKGNLRIWIG